MRLFEGKGFSGVKGLYPFTAENLLRVGLALCTYIKVKREIERPALIIKDEDFIAFSLAVGFMAGGGDVVYGEGEGDVRLKLSCEGEGVYRLEFDGLEEHEFLMVESILFSRYNMPRAEGEGVGRIWIQEKKP
ncbi:MAG: hypothetical protein D6699_03115 [Aquificota bacterium]|nr:MAG: hypothetical protein D6699_03115 [Aquificota bacterium]